MQRLLQGSYLYFRGAFTLFSSVGIGVKFRKLKASPTYIRVERSQVPPYIGVSGSHTSYSAEFKDHGPERLPDSFPCYILLCSLAAPATNRRAVAVEQYPWASQSFVVQG